MRHVTFVIERIMCFGRRSEDGGEKKHISSTTTPRQAMQKMQGDKRFSTTKYDEHAGQEVRINDRINDRPHVR